MVPKDFVGKGVVAKTKHIRSFRLQAASEEECHQKLHKMGFLVPVYAQEIPPAPAPQPESLT